MTPSPFARIDAGLTPAQIAEAQAAADRILALRRWEPGQETRSAVERQGEAARLCDATAAHFRQLRTRP